MTIQRYHNEWRQGISRLARDQAWDKTRGYCRSVTGESLWHMVASLPFEGGTIYLGPGRYNIMDTLTLNRSNVQIIGNRDAIIDVGGDFIVLAGDDMTIEGVTFVVEDAASPTNVDILRLTGERCQIKNCFMDQITDRGISMQGKRSLVQGCTWTGTATDNLIHAENACVGPRILGNDMDGNRAATDIITVDGTAGSDCTYVIIDDNWVQGGIAYPNADTQYGENQGSAHPA
jgi:hypothetical protein